MASFAVSISEGQTHVHQYDPHVLLQAVWVVQGQRQLVDPSIKEITQN